MKTEYLLFNIIVATGPFLASFISTTKKIKFRYFLFSLIFVSLPFIIWDIFVNNYFWYFNKNYITDIRLYNLPIEEILFFITVPYACLFLWKNIPEGNKIISTRILSSTISVICIFLTIKSISNQWFYTSIVLIISSVLLAIDSILNIKKNLKKIIIFESFLFITIFIFNGYLTYRQIITYNPNLKSNLMIGTIPIEDFLYGFILINSIIFIYESIPNFKFFLPRKLK